MAAEESILSTRRLKATRTESGYRVKMRRAVAVAFVRMEGLGEDKREWISGVRSRARSGEAVRERKSRAREMTGEGNEGDRSLRSWLVARRRRSEEG